MTRKRFIKLCMAGGMSRNEANERAAEVRGSGLPYASVFCRATPWQDIADAFSELGRKLHAVARQLAAAWLALVECLPYIAKEADTDGLEE